jgi:hypothetical protein
MDQHRKGTERPLHARLGNVAACDWQKWKSTITPYCLRPQPAADMKAGGQLDSTKVSAAPGHVIDATKSTYDHANMCKGRGVGPARVTAARKVKARVAAKMKQSVGMVK